MKVVNMEADILKALKFELGGPTVKTFLRFVCVFCWIYVHVALILLVLVVFVLVFGLTLKYALAFLFAGDSPELLKRVLM